MKLKRQTINKIFRTLVPEKKAKKTPSTLTSLVMTKDKFSYLEEFVMFLRPIAQGIDILQSHNDCFFSEVLPTLFSLCTHLKQVLEKNPLMKHIHSVIPALISRL